MVAPTYTYADNFNLFGHSGITTAAALSGFTPGATDVTATSDGTEPTSLAAIRSGTLALNGATTQTHALVGGSPAIDRAPDTDCVAPSPTNGVDQRDVARNQDGDNSPGSGNECDIGAYEYVLEPTANACLDGVGGFELTQLVGTGIYKPGSKTNQSSLTLANPADLVELYAQFAGKRYGTPTKVIFQTLNGNQLVDKVVFNKKFPTSPAYRAAAVYWYGAQLDPAGKVTLRVNETFKKNEATPRAFIVYPTYSTDEESFNYFEVLQESIENHVYYGPGFIPQQNHIVAIPPPQAAVTIIATIALVDNDPDNRPVYLTVLAGGVSQFFSPTNPNQGNMLNIINVELPFVPAGTDEVVFNLVSPSPNGEVPAGGDSAAMVGLTINYSCVPPG